MRLLLDTEQRALAETVRDVLTDHAAPSRVREIMDTGEEIDRPLWKRLSSDLGLIGLAVPERYGGSGTGQVERCVVLEELGASLAQVPYLATAVYAVDVLLAVGDEQACTDLLPGLASGEVIGAIAVSDEDGVWGSSPRGVEARERDGRWELNGCISFVVSGNLADLLLVYTATPSGPGWFAVEADAAGCGRTALRTMDPTRGMARIDFTATAARPLRGTDPAIALELVGDRAAVALAAEQVGGMSRVLRMTVDYAKVRVQFGRPIGSYQAVKHACADMYTSYQQAVSVVRYGAWAGDHAPGELPAAAATTTAFVAPAYFRAAADGVQLHGGLGYTWEHDAHLHYKRAKTGELLLGGAAESRLRLADRLAV